MSQYYSIDYSSLYPHRQENRSQARSSFKNSSFPKASFPLTIPTESTYKFVQPLPDKYLCGICKSVLTEPHATECCGQHFCKECLEKAESASPKYPTEKKTEKKLPSLQGKNFNHFRYLPFKREIDSLKVYCPRKSSGCKVQVAYSDRKSHDEACEFVKVDCTSGCGEKIFKKNMTHHIQRDCRLRKSKCRFCGIVGNYKDIQSSVHQSECPDVVLQCSHYCGAQFKRKAEKQHESVCPEVQVDCDFAEIGCKAKIKRKDLESHMSTNMKYHLSQLMTAHVILKQEFKEYKEKHEGTLPPSEPEICGSLGDSSKPHACI